jgi:hypothetical protein
MADQVNPGRGEEHEESQESGLFLSSEPIEGAGSPLRALGDDTDAGDTDAGDTDAGDTDAVDTDRGDTDGGDGGGPEEKGDLADGGADTDNTDESADAMDIVGDNMDGTTTKDADATDAK